MTILQLLNTTITYMPTKFGSNPPRPWPDTIAFDAIISIGSVIKFVWWIHAPIFTVGHRHYHLSTSLFESRMNHKQHNIVARHRSKKHNAYKQIETVVSRPANPIHPFHGDRHSDQSSQQYQYSCSIHLLLHICVPEY